jgi:hypothetical protein
VTPRPLTDDECRAASQLGQGATQQTVADELGVSVKTVRRLTKREDFAALVEEARDDHRPYEVAGDGQPTPRGVLEEVLVATNRNGEPNKPLRMQAAIALSKLPDDAASGGPVVERVYVLPSDAAHDEVIAILEATPPNVSVGIVDGDAGLAKLADRIVPDADGGRIHVLSSGPYRPSRPEEPAPQGDAHPDPDPPRGRGG